MNDNGQRLLELCTYHNLCITNTFFQTKPQHRVSWRHPRSKHWHQLDVVIARRNNLKNVLLTRSYHSADCNTDHSLVCSKLKLRPKKLYCSKPAGRPCIDARKTANSEKAEKFRETLQENLCSGPGGADVTSKWQHLRDTVYNTALSVFGRRARNTNDWFEANSDEMIPAIEKQRAALLEYKRSPSQSTQQALRAARRTVQQTARRCANNHWLQLCSSIQTCADFGNLRGMYEGMRKALGPTQNMTAPLKSKSGDVIADKAKQMERWVERYSELYSRENIVVDAALGAIELLPVMDELGQEPTVDELKRAIDSTAVGEAPAQDAAPPESSQNSRSPKKLLVKTESRTGPEKESYSLNLSRRHSRELTGAK
ncbi:uncharacterized protein LOC142024904 isoform X1 [Carettochelys insculpta]|uniref:uncharacterized protein LOC142024904 isoform X1 n=1 Tax=Carettochelys insculpta TaxID=44489 RepID=UPI003EBC1FCA